MLRYFNQVRQKALETMVKAYCSGKSVVQYRLSKMTELLAFEDDRDCASFCIQHGISAELEADTIYMDKMRFYFADSNSQNLRARNLIELKRETPWSIVINGNMPLPENPYLSYVPHDSFDENGCLKLEAFEAMDQNMLQSVVPPSPNSEEVAKINAERANEQAVTAVAEDLILNVVREESIKIGNGFIRSIKLAELSRNLSDTIKNEVVEDILLEVSREAIKEVRNEELQRRLAHEAKIQAVEEVAEEVTDKLIDEVLVSLAGEVANQEMSCVSKTLALFTDVPHVVEDMLNEVINEVTYPIAKGVLEESYQERENEIRALKQRQVTRMKRLTFKSWRKYVLKRKSQRSILKNFPCMAKSIRNLDSNVKVTSIGKTLELRKQVDQLHEVSRT